MSKRAFVTGLTGQDGAYLAKLLLDKDYEVHGLIRRSSVDNLSRLGPLASQLQLHYGDLGDSGSLVRALRKAQPDEVFNLGAMSHVGVSFDNPEYTVDVTGAGAIRLLEAVRDTCPNARFYQASSSEMFGSTPPPQNEETPFHPRSPYGCSKVFAYWAAVNYRESYGMFVSNGILFNHESPRRGETFVTRKITRAVANIHLGRQNKLLLGNLRARRDWGFAGDFVNAMWLMLQHDTPDDFVVATGEMHTVAEFCEAAFSVVALDWREHVQSDAALFRPAEVDALQGDSTKARQLLGWQPKVSFSELAKMMVESDIESLA
jgi:GDPmannose 4,6-dehydratase